MKHRLHRLTLACAALLLALGCEPATHPNTPSPMPADSAAQARPVIYQMLVRHFSNANTTRKPWGSISENGIGKFNGITAPALGGLKELGITHVWYTGVLEHATATAFPEAGIPADDADVVKGILGSPYAIKDYYDVSPALAEDPKRRMAEFEALLDRTHQAGLKAIIDFVPNHVARSYHSDAKPQGVQDLGEGDDAGKPFAPDNNFYYLPGKDLVVPVRAGSKPRPDEDRKFAESPAKATGNNVFSERPSIDDWFETVKLNYGIDMQADGQPKHFDPVPGTWVKMRDILLFWAGKGVDGFRCDVAEMVPVEFWEYAIPAVKEQHPAVIFIAEIYTPSMYKDYVTKGHFDYLYDKVGLYDKVRPLMEGKPEARVAGIREALQQSEGIEGHMLRFLENHDEQRIASAGFAGDARMGIPGMAATALLGTGPVMLYFGQEVGEKGEGAEGFGGEDGRTTIFDYWGVPAHQAWLNGGKFDGGGLDAAQKALRADYARLMQLSQGPAFVAGERTILDDSIPSTLAFVRHGQGDPMLVLVHFGRTESPVAELPITADQWKAWGLDPAKPIVATERYAQPTDQGADDASGPFVAADGKPYRVQLWPMATRVLSLRN